MFGKMTNSKIDKWAEKKNYKKILGSLEKDDIAEYGKETLKKGCPDSAEALAEGIVSKKDKVQTACKEIISEMGKQHGNELVFEISKNVIYNGLSLKDAFKLDNEGEKIYQKRLAEIKSVINGVSFSVTGAISSNLRKLMVPSEEIFSDAFIIVEEDYDTGEKYATLEVDDFKSYVCDIVRPVVELSLPFGLPKEAAQETLDLCDFAYGAVLRSLGKLSKKIKGTTGLADKDKFEKFKDAAMIIKNVIDVRNKYIAKALGQKHKSLKITEWPSDYISYASNEFLGSGKVSWSPAYEKAVELSKAYAAAIPLDDLK